MARRTLGRSGASHRTGVDISTLTCSGIADQVEDYNAHGIECVPGRRGSKAAAVSGVYKRNFTPEEFWGPDFLIKTGTVSGWLVDVEGDEPEAVRALKPVLPRTLRSGRGVDLTAHN